MVYTFIIIFGAIVLGSASAAPIVWELNDLEARDAKLSPRGTSTSKYVDAGSVNVNYVTPEQNKVIQLAELRGRRAAFWAQRGAVVAAGRNYAEQLTAINNVAGNSAGLGVTVALVPGAPTTERHLISSTSIVPQHIDQNPPTEHQQYM